MKLKIRDMTERFSMKETLKSKFGEAEKSVKGSRATKRAMMELSLLIQESIKSKLLMVLSIWF